MKHIRVFIIVFSLPLMLLGCFGGESLTLEEFQGDAYVIGIPEGWTRLTRREFHDQIPQEAVSAFMSSDPTINITIVREFLASDALSLEYANANIVNAEKNILEYEKITIDEGEIAGGKTKIHVFKGKASPSDLLLKFVQVYAVKNKTGYTITGTLYLDSTNDDVEQIKNMILSFKFKEGEDPVL